MNLLEDMNQVVGSGSFAWIGRAVGEPPDVTSRSTSVGLPALLGGLTTMGETPSGASKILDLIRGNRLDEPDAFTRLGAMGNAPDSLRDQGKGALGSIFGTKLDGVVGALSGASQVKRSTMSAMLAMLAPVSLAVIGKRAREGHLDASGLSSLLRSQQPSLVGVLPESVATTLGLGALSPHAYDRPVVETARPATRETIHREPVRAAAPKRRSVWPWAALALAGLLALFLYFNGRREPRGAELRAPQVTEPSLAPRIREPRAPEPPSPRRAEAPTPPAVAPAQRAEAPTPPAPAQRAEAPTPPAPAQRAEAPTPPAVAPTRPAEPARPGEPAQRRQPDEHAALDAENVEAEIRFDVDSADLPATDPTIDRVANALRENPDAEVRVIGYTDSTGPSEHNEALARRRAQAVEAALVDRGVQRNRIDVAAEAATRPAATNATDEGRSANRRVEIRLQNP